MSVIAGLVDWTNSVSGRSLTVVRTMLAPFAPQSPDGIQINHWGAGALGVGRLETGSQRRRADGVLDNGDAIVAFDGRLDRTSDLKGLFGLEATASDSMIVLAAYENYRRECFRLLRGDFAIAIWDRRTKILLAARDTFSVRPLYFAANDALFAFASDPEQLLAAGLVSADFDDESIVDYLLWDSRSVGRTFFRQVKALPGGHCLSVDRQGYKISPFLPVALNKVRLRSKDDYWSEYRQRFRAAVVSCLESAGPVVAELSGGLDSSSIVCVADGILREGGASGVSLSCAGGLYPGLSCDEEPFIREVEKSVTVPVECWNATEGSINELEHSSIAIPGGRFATFAGTDGQFVIAKARGARVLLSGFGGDQVGGPAGGLRDAVIDFRWRDAARIVFERPEADVRSLAKILGRLARSLAPQWLRRMRALVTSTKPTAAWLSEWARKLARPQPEHRAWVTLESEIQRRIWRAVTCGAHSMAQAYSQHSSIRAAVNFRYPFLDLDLVSLVLSIPSAYWPPPWPFERLHRSILGNTLPPRIAQRRTKAGFSPALALRVRRHLPTIRDLFSSRDWRSERYVERREAQRLLAELESKEHPALSVCYPVWAIATLEAWLRAVSRYTHAVQWEAA